MKHVRAKTFQVIALFKCKTFIAPWPTATCQSCLPLSNKLYPVREFADSASNSARKTIKNKKAVDI
jgi:hypothetical protein